MNEGKRKGNLDKGLGEVKERRFSHEMRVFKKLESPEKQLVEERKRRMAGVVNDTGEAESRGGLNMPVLFAESLENGSDEKEKDLVLVGEGEAQLGGEKSNGVDADISDDRVRVPEALNDAGDHLGKVRKEEDVVVSGQGSHQPHALLSYGSLLLPLRLQNARQERPYPFRPQTLRHTI